MLWVSRSLLFITSFPFSLLLTASICFRNTTAHIELSQSIVAHLKRFIERLSTFMYPIAMLFAHNSTAFIYQLHCN